MKVELNYLDHIAVVSVKNENEHIQKHWIKGQFYETQRNGMLNYIYQNEPKGGKYIDIGASIGNHSVFFLAIMGASELHSFEPHKECFAELEQNIYSNLNFGQKAFAENVAIGREESNCLMLSHSEDNVGMMQVEETDFNDERTTPIFPLDHYYNETKGYDCIKIDVEHYNEQLLIGAERTLTDGSGTVYIEAESKEELATVDHYMNKYGYYRIQNIVLNHTPTYIYTTLFETE